MLQDAIIVVEEVGSTLASTSPSQTKKHKQSVAVPVYVGHHQHNGDYAVPMELGVVMKFTGKCYLCGKLRQRATNCYADKHRKIVLQPAANHT